LVSIRALGALRLFLGQLVASLAKVNLHVFPMKPIAIFVRKNEAAVKALELIFSRFEVGVLHGISLLSVEVA
jgi:hypothetical protein